MGNEFPLEVILAANNSFQNVKVQLFYGKEIVQEKKFKTLKKGIHKVTFIDKANEKGIMEYKVVISSEKIDKNLLNNSKKTAVEVIDYSQKILILSSGSHPDIAALNWALEDQLKSKVTTFQIDDFNGKISDYDLLIFHKPTSSEILMKLLRKVENGNTILNYFRIRNNI